MQYRLHLQQGKVASKNMLDENILIVMDIIWKRPRAIFPSINEVNQQWFIIWMYHRVIALRIPHYYQLDSIRSNIRFKTLGSENETCSSLKRLYNRTLQNELEHIRCLKAA